MYGKNRFRSLNVFYLDSSPYNSFEEVEPGTLWRWVGDTAHYMGAPAECNSLEHLVRYLYQNECFSNKENSFVIRRSPVEYTYDRNTAFMFLGWVVLNRVTTRLFGFGEPMKKIGKDEVHVPIFWIDDRYIHGPAFFSWIDWSQTFDMIHDPEKLEVEPPPELSEQP